MAFFERNQATILWVLGVALSAFIGWNEVQRRIDEQLHRIDLRLQRIEINLGIVPTPDKPILQ